MLKTTAFAKNHFADQTLILHQRFFFMRKGNTAGSRARQSEINARGAIFRKNQTPLLYSKDAP
jgi:hypothetical protein